MARITGIGGVFYATAKKDEVLTWYKDILGMDTSDYGVFFPHDPGANTAFQLGVFNDDTEYFAPSKKDFMINLKVDNLAEFVTYLKSKGVAPTNEIVEEEGCGLFTWIMDPAGNKLELWQPPADTQ